ncbi:hypothetical protein EH151_12695 [Elizabethkingia anophelis]|uniref:hypothetical protein n=1 Tax=Elizabethkingia anophelis TaxID=1117645 RepID=UPI001371314F|nr:hypothetical protein [Elizabethkingia anophelis]MYZ60745.1 hypothetical protein [Elizabethkingia anophelis]
MKRLEQIKDEVAEEHGYNSYKDVVDLLEIPFLMIDEIIKRYAREVAQASLDKASENAATIFTNHEQTRSEVYKPSITHESNIVML